MSSPVCLSPFSPLYHSSFVLLPQLIPPSGCSSLSFSVPFHPFISPSIPASLHPPLLIARLPHRSLLPHHLLFARPFFHTFYSPNKSHCLLSAVADAPERPLEPMDRQSPSGKQRTRPSHHGNRARPNTAGSPSSVTFHQKLQAGGFYLPYTYNGN